LRQFDAVPNPSKSSAQIAPYLVVLQSHLLDGLDSVIVAPAVRDAARLLTVFEIAVEIAGDLAIPELFAIERATLPRPTASLAAHEDEIRRALDRLFTGF
jgi:toxin CcdB